MGEMVTMLVLWLVVIGVMWFLLMRPQKKEQKRNIAFNCDISSSCINN